MNVWLLVVKALDYIQRFDTDGDGLPNNQGPDGPSILQGQAILGTDGRKRRTWSHDTHIIAIADTVTLKTNGETTCEYSIKLIYN